MKPQAIPIDAAKQIAQEYGYDQVVIIAHKLGKDGEEWMTTYGVNKVHCGIAARMGAMLRHWMSLGKVAPQPAVKKDQPERQGYGQAKS